MDISNLLAQYSLGNFDYEIPLSKNLDEIDSIISSINMLGEELKETTISRDFFSSIYNAVSNLLFIIDENGVITGTNHTSSETFPQKKLIGSHFNDLLNEASDQYSLKNLRKKISKKNPIYKFETELKINEKKIIFVSCSISHIETQEIKGFFIVAEDITQKKESDQKVLRAIMQTEESERKRVADDLHDSLGQGLSSMKMMLGVAKQNAENNKQNEIISSSITILENSIQELRNICFNLMPSILEKGGLTYAIKQLIETTAFEIQYFSNVSTLKLNKKQELAVYRVIQEFINNSIKHAFGTKITIKIEELDNKITIKASDNGIGFKQEINLKSDSRGLNTMRSRIESFGGKYELSSSPKHGTSLKIMFLI